MKKLFPGPNDHYSIHLFSVLNACFVQRQNFLWEELFFYQVFLYLLLNASSNAQVISGNRITRYISPLISRQTHKKSYYWTEVWDTKAKRLSLPFLSSDLEQIWEHKLLLDCGWHTELILLWKLTLLEMPVEETGTNHAIEKFVRTTFKCETCQPLQFENKSANSQKLSYPQIKVFFLAPHSLYVVLLACLARN